MTVTVTGRVAAAAAGAGAESKPEYSTWNFNRELEPGHAGAGDSGRPAAPVLGGLGLGPERRPDRA